ncbi:hypothetical protein BKA67DRAFT_117583 [Truncatella angustata]|uniref:Secreted protein n=1 Tax=Truncatella angustata TaxID=152316 RepID=A0A9P8RGG8_9PEZI|nr:uncharacterized protein BKA67DRAFT_117583 [Truncatella angustata]KAH6645564.1 hypothetical protein BKA67DRAFT_117583 [Truncatella angustata]
MTKLPWLTRTVLWLLIEPIVCPKGCGMSAGSITAVDLYRMHSCRFSGLFLIHSSVRRHLKGKRKDEFARWWAAQREASQCMIERPSVVPILVIHKHIITKRCTDSIRKLASKIKMIFG